MSFKGFATSSNHSTSEITLKEGNYSSDVNIPNNYSTSINPIFINASSQANFYGILYQPLNFTNYSFSTSTVFQQKPFATESDPHSWHFRIRSTVKEFTLSNGAFVNTLSLLLSGKGVIYVSIGTTVLGGQVLEKESVHVNGLNYYTVAFPDAFLAGNTQYFLNLYNVSSHHLLRSSIESGVSSTGLGNLSVTASSEKSQQGSQFVSVITGGNHGNPHAVFTGTFTIGFDPKTGALPRDALFFYDYGLNNGSIWSVTLNGTTYTSQNRFIQVDGLKGSFTYKAGSASGMLPLIADGTIAVNTSSYPKIVPVVFYDPAKTPVAGINSSMVAYGITGVSQKFNVADGGIINHIAVMLKGTGSVNVSLGYTPHGNQIMKNETIKTSGSSGNWYSLMVPDTFFSGSENYYISVFGIMGNVEWAFSLFPFPPYDPSYHVASGFASPFLDSGYIFNLSYSPGISTSENSSVFFIEYGLTSGTAWGVGILAGANLVIGSLVSLNGGSWMSVASLYAVSGIKNNMSLTFDLSNGSSLVSQFSYKNNNTTTSGTYVTLSPEGRLIMAISIVPDGYGHGVESFVVYISSTSTGSHVRVTYAVTINVAFSFFGNI
ncbi:MAG: hypothetical protein QW597_04820 [Thermoplasmataceae archaeon]